MLSSWASPTGWRPQDRRQGPSWSRLWSICGRICLHTFAMLHVAPSGGPIAAPISPLNMVCILSAWLVHPAEGRSTFLHGDLLHGVLPSAGTVNVTAFKGAARISLNVAWWPHECRKPKHDDLSQAPPANSRWAQLLASSESPTLWINKPFHDVFCGEDQCGRMAQKSFEL